MNIPGEGNVRQSVPGHCEELQYAEDYRKTVQFPLTTKQKLHWN